MERRARTGLGREFLDSVEESLERLKKLPDLGIPVHKTMRRLNVRRFPSGNFYVPIPDGIEVVGVLHERRAPRLWKKRYPQ